MEIRSGQYPSIEQILEMAYIPGSHRIQIRRGIESEDIHQVGNGENNKVGRSFKNTVWKITHP